MPGSRVPNEFFRNQDVSPSSRLCLSFCRSQRGWPVSRGRSYIIHPPAEGRREGVVAGWWRKKSCRAKTIISARAKRAERLLRSVYFASLALSRSFFLYTFTSLSPYIYISSRSFRSCGKWWEQRKRGFRRETSSDSLFVRFSGDRERSSLMRTMQRASLTEVGSSGGVVS